MGSNQPPAVSLELTKEEAQWLHGLLSKAHTGANSAFRDVCSMSSSDPRSRFRSMLTMSANIDQSTSEQLAERIQTQQPDFEKAWEEDRMREKDVT